MPGRRPSTRQGGSAAGSRRGSSTLAVTGVRKGKKKLGPDAAKDLSQRLRRNFDEEERRQLADWLDATHKQLDKDLRKLGVGGSKAVASSFRDDATGEALEILSRRLNLRQRRPSSPGQGKRQASPHVHHYVVEDDLNNYGREDQELEMGTGPRRSFYGSSSPPLRATISHHPHEAWDGSSGGGMSRDPRAFRVRGYGSSGNEEPPEKRQHQLPLSARLQDAMIRQGYSKEELVRLFLPPSSMPSSSSTRGQTVVTLQLSEVEEVLRLDLGLILSERELVHLVEEFGGGDARRVDIQALLESCGLWSSRGLEPSSAAMEAAMDLDRRHWATRMSHRDGHDDHDLEPGYGLPRRSTHGRGPTDAARRHGAASLIQRVYRGHLGRSRAHNVRFKRHLARTREASRLHAMEPARGIPRRGPDGRVADVTKGRRSITGSPGRYDDRRGGCHMDEDSEGSSREEELASRRGDRMVESEEEEVDTDVLLAKLGYVDAMADKSSGSLRGASTTQDTSTCIMEVFSPAAQVSGAQGGGAAPTPMDPLKWLDQTDWSKALPYNTTVVAKVVEGGMKALRTLARAVRDLSYNGAPGHSPVRFHSCAVIRSALGFSGYDLEAVDAYRFLSGLGTDRDGRVDAFEVVQAISDILVEKGCLPPSFSLMNNSWMDPTTTTSGQAMDRGGTFLHGTVFGMVAEEEEEMGPDGRSRRAGWTMAEMRIQHQYKNAHGKVVKGRAVMRPFLLRDPFDDGHLSLRDFMDAVMDLGYDLNADDFSELAYKYRCPPEVLEGTETGDDAGHRISVDYAPFVRFLVELNGTTSGQRRRRSHPGSDDDEEEEDREGSDVGDGSGYHRSRRFSSAWDGQEREVPGEVVDWSMHENALGLIKDWLYGQEDKREWLRSLRGAFAKADPSGRGSLNSKVLAKVLRDSRVDVRDEDLQELAALLRSPHHEGELHYPRLMRVWDLVMSCPQEGALGLIDQLLYYVGKSTTMRLRWVRRFKKQCVNQDKYRTGVLDMEVLGQLLSHNDGSDALKPKELRALLDAFVTDGMEGIAYRYLLRTLSQQAGKWYEIDPVLVQSLLGFFPKLSAPSHFISHLRRSFRDLDTDFEGKLETDDVEHALYLNNIALEDDVLAKLLEALDRDASHTVYYEDILELYEVYQLPWYEAVDDIAFKVGRAVFGGKSSWKVFTTLRQALCSEDRTQAGVIAARSFTQILHVQGVDLSADEMHRLVEALEVAGRSHKEAGALVRYRELLKYLLKLNEAAVREFLASFYDNVRYQLADQEDGFREGVERVHRGCMEHDKDGTGRVSIDGLRGALQRAGVKVALEDVGRAADYSDFFGDGKLSIQAILDKLSCPSSGRPRGGRGGHHGGHGSTRDWGWTKSPIMKSIRHDLHKLSHADRQNTVTQVFHEFDEKDEGVIYVDDLPDILLMLGASKSDLTPAELRALGEQLFDHHGRTSTGGAGGRRYIPYEELVKSLILDEKELEARYPGPQMSKREEGLLYERLMERRKNSIVGSKLLLPSKDDPGSSRRLDDQSLPPEERFLAGCKKIDRRNTGFVSARDVRILVTQVGHKISAANLKAALDRVKYTKLADVLFRERKEEGDPEAAERRRARRAEASADNQMDQEAMRQQVEMLAKLLSSKPGDTITSTDLPRLLKFCGIQIKETELNSLLRNLGATRRGMAVQKAALLDKLGERANKGKGSR